MGTSINAASAPPLVVSADPPGSKTFRVGGFYDVGGDVGVAAELKIHRFEWVGKPLDLSIVAGVGAFGGIPANQQISHFQYLDVNPYAGAAAHFYATSRFGISAEATGGARFEHNVNSYDNAPSVTLNVTDLTLGANLGLFVDVGASATRIGLSAGVTGVLPQSASSGAAKPDAYAEPNLRLSLSF